MKTSMHAETPLSCSYGFLCDLKTLLRISYFRSHRTHNTITVFFNLGSSEARGSTLSSLGSVKILKLALFWVSRFRQMLNNVSKVPRLKKRLKNAAVSSLYHSHSLLMSLSLYLINLLLSGLQKNVFPSPLYCFKIV